ncbi:hypothetical protein D3C84_1216610 [compost metagenome]
MAYHRLHAGQRRADSDHRLFDAALFDETVIPSVHDGLFRRHRGVRLSNEF